jgi:sodium transport system permease protein
VLLPALAFLSVRVTARRAGESIPKALGLALPSRGHALGALLVAPALALFAHGVISLQNELLPLPSRLIEAGEELLSLEDLSPLALVFVMAISPGVCEDLLFRGAILSGLRRDLPPVRAVLLQAMLFGWAHSSVHRFLPTFLVGVALGFVALRTRSLWPAVLLHVSYNALLVLSGAHPWLGDPRLALLALPGVLLLARGHQEEVPGGARPGPVPAA